jgi:hypothetical protein
MLGLGEDADGGTGTLQAQDPSLARQVSTACIADGFKGSLVSLIFQYFQTQINCLYNNKKTTLKLD